MSLRTITLDADGGVTSLTDKTIPQFSHNQVIIAVLVPKSIPFDSSFIVYRNEFADIREWKAIYVNASYVHDSYYQILIPMTQEMTETYGSLDCWIVLRDGDDTVIYSDTIYLYVCKSQAISQNVVESDIATDIESEVARNAKEINDLKKSIIDLADGKEIVVKYGASASGRKQIFYDDDVNLTSHDDGDLLIHEIQ